jgi:hypothetical protein
MTSRIHVLQIVLLAIGLFLLLWWPLSHWLYPVWYHTVLGFEDPAQYADNALIKVIGTAGFFPALLLFFAAINPLRNRDIVKVLIINGLVGGIATSYLIATGQFPARESLNVLLYFAAALGMTILYPWKLSGNLSTTSVKSDVPISSEE